MKLLAILVPMFMSATYALADTTILLTRHGDRDTLAEDLNAKGRARAAALPAAVAEFDIAAIYAPDKPRNLDTAAPLAEKLGIPVTVLDPRKAAVILRSAYPDRAVIWIGNTDNLVTIFEALGGTGAPPEFYGDIYVLTLTDSGETAVGIRHYGP